MAPSMANTIPNPNQDSCVRLSRIGDRSTLKALSKIGAAGFCLAGMVVFGLSELVQTSRAGSS